MNDKLFVPNEQNPGRWTARDLLAFVNLSHEDHTVMAASKLREVFTIKCSCGEILTLDCVERNTDVTFCKAALRNVSGIQLT